MGTILVMRVIFVGPAGQPLSACPAGPARVPFRPRCPSPGDQGIGGSLKCSAALLGTFIGLLEYVMLRLVLSG